MADRPYLIDPNVVTHQGSISEDELRRRLVREAIEQAGWIGDGGLPIVGVTARITRGQGKAGGYTVQVSRDLRQSNQPRIGGPKDG